MKLFASVAVASAMLVSAHANAVDCTPVNVTLETQAEIDGFQGTQGVGVTCDTVTGRLLVQDGADITNLDGLSAIVAVNGRVQIQDLSELTSLSGLSALQGTVSVLTVQRNNKLEDMDALAGVTAVSGNVTALNNPVLTNINGLSGLEAIGGNINLRNLPLITDLNGLSSVRGVVNRIDLRGNNALLNVDGLYSITDVAQNIEVRNNASLGNVRGLSNVEGVVGNLTLRGNSSLDNCDGVFQLVDTRDDGPSGPGTAPSPDVGGAITLSGNLATCNSVAAIIAAGPLAWDVASGDWSTAANWYPQRVPGLDDRPVISNSGTAIASAGTVDALDLTAGDIALGGDGNFSASGADINIAGDLLSASGLVDAVTMASRDVSSAVSVASAASMTIGGDLNFSRIHAVAVEGDNVSGRLRPNSVGDVSAIASLSVGGDLSAGMVVSETTGSSATRQRGLYRPTATLAVNDVPALGVAGSLNIGVVAAVETSSASTRGDQSAIATVTLQNVSATIGSVTRIGVIDQSAAFSGQTPISRATSDATGSLLMRSSALSSSAVQVAVVAAGHVGTASGTLELNPSYINTGALDIGSGGSLTLNVDGLTRASAATVGQPGLYSAIDASSANIAGPVNVVFNFTPEEGSYDFDLITAATISLAPGSSTNVQNLPAGFEVTAFDVQPGASGGSVYRLSISSDGGGTDPNDPTTPPGSAPIKVPTMGAWPMALLVLLVIGVVGRRSRSS